MRQPRLVDQRTRYSLIRTSLPNAPASVCEVGVGGGWLIHSLHDEGYDVHGCDVSLKDFPANSPIADRILQTSGAKLPFPDNSFDATYSCDVLEHVYPSDRADFMAELVRVTKPGGVVTLTAFFRNTFSFRLWGVWHLLMRGTLPTWYTEHLTIPPPREEETFIKLSQSLLNVERVRYQRALNLLIMCLQCATRQRQIVRIVDATSFLVPAWDVVGSTTSTFFTGTKPQ